MSCCESTPSVNPERPGEVGKWVHGPRPASRSATCIHTWRGQNALGVVGGPVVKVCTGCGETHWPTWVRETTIEIQVSALTATREESPELADWLAVEPVREAGKRGAAA